MLKPVFVVACLVHFFHFCSLRCSDDSTLKVRACRGTASQPATSLRSHGPSFRLGCPLQLLPRTPVTPAAALAPTPMCLLTGERTI